MTITEFDGFAVYQIGYAIYGVGLDADSARSDAAEWLGDDGDDAGSVPAYRPGAFVSGDTVVIQCTAALVAQVERDGGADGFRETHDEVGRLALCTEEAEADAESEY